MGDCIDKYLELEDYGIAIPCVHDLVPSNSCKKLIVRLSFNMSRNLVYYHRNGKRWVSKQNIPATKGSRVNPFCPMCIDEIAKFLILKKKITKHVVYQILEILNDEVWNKVLKIDKEEPIIEIHDHKVDGVCFAPDKVCNEEEFRAWIAKGNHAFEEEIPAIEGLESVNVDDDDDDDDENVCGICLRGLKNMDKDNINDEKGTDNVNVSDDVGIKTISLLKLPCKHVFHEPCVLRWLHKNHVCPFCRFQLPQSGTVVHQ
ncbi:uncharacterized protein [Spinacia oleracea]|uniref:RING-type E3 ubiquitin transferase n=1 Tax=Spinacia oleracea TaxID=3562 RepID=A0A9R0IMN7_SPIOL|nr:uncharacterized protein LOC110791271 [Spinacia oleracea]